MSFILHRLILNKLEKLTTKTRTGRATKPGFLPFKNMTELENFEKSGEDDAYKNLVRKYISILRSI